MSFDYLWDGFSVALSLQNLLIGLIGCFLGTMIGALPAIGPINGIALLLPIAYTMGLPPESTMILLAAIYCGAEYGGRISSILLNVPGDAGAVMTALDGYPMARQGRAGPGPGSPGKVGGPAPRGKVTQLLPLDAAQAAVLQAKGAGIFNFNEDIHSVRAGRDGCVVDGNLQR